MADVLTCCVSFFSVGNTHEDIDALFGVIRKYLMDKEWSTVEEFAQLVREALQGQGGRVVVEIITDALDFSDWLKPCANKRLALYSRHGPDILNPGMHVMRYVGFKKNTFDHI